jgi:hypothetical protein
MHLLIHLSILPPEIQPPNGRRFFACAFVRRLVWIWMVSEDEKDVSAPAIWHLCSHVNTLAVASIAGWA